MANDPTKPELTEQQLEDVSGGAARSPARERQGGIGDPGIDAGIGDPGLTNTPVQVPPNPCKVTP